MRRLSLKEIFFKSYLKEINELVEFVTQEAGVISNTPGVRYYLERLILQHSLKSMQQNIPAIEIPTYSFNDLYNSYNLIKSHKLSASANFTDTAQLLKVNNITFSEKPMQFLGELITQTKSGANALKEALQNITQDFENRVTETATSGQLARQSNFNLQSKCDVLYPNFFGNQHKLFFAIDELSPIEEEIYKLFQENNIDKVKVNYNENKYFKRSDNSIIKALRGFKDPQNIGELLANNYEKTLKIQQHKSKLQHF